MHTASMRALRPLIWAVVVATPALITAAGTATAQSPCGPTTTVQPGDTYFSIAQRCAVSIAQIEQANPGQNPSTLQVGQTLQLVAETPARAEPMPDRPVTDAHRVEPGDTLSSIAAILGTSVEALIAANPQIDPYALDVGAVIRLPGSDAPEAPGTGMNVSGVLTEEGVECQAMRGHDGQLYSLVGDIDAYESGDVVEVRGTSPEVSICMQGTTIEVEAIRRIG